MQTVVNFEITDKKIQELQKLFEKFLNDYQIEQTPTRRKSERAFMCRR